MSVGSFRPLVAISNRRSRRPMLAGIGGGHPAIGTLIALVQL
ncbi:hypothetical protein BOS5A_180026 [Bosea sp. EC-HK365B]|nr:hypothetical protein BOS5A_180026 [Bosea sp. EC-HK365B]VXB47791.1 hypothetical protein BOSE127_120138 [Bosea sp. 127]